MILLRVSLFFIFLLILPDWYIYKTYIKPKHKKISGFWYWIPSIILLIALAVFLFLNPLSQKAFSYYLIITLCIAVPKTVFTICNLLLKGIKKLIRLPLFEGFISFFIAIATFGYLLFGVTKGKEYFQIKEVSFFSPQLPEAFDGYRILQISDLHTGSWKGNKQAIQKAITLCNAQHADLAVFTGDLVNSRADEVLEFMPILSQLHAKDGVFSILGNHDYATYTKWENEEARLRNIDSLLVREKQMGWQMLLNDNYILHRGNDSIALIGVENSGNPPFPDKADLPKALTGTDNMFKILLSHDPTHWRRNILPETDIQLTLSGHTHDMQISLWGFSISQFIYPEHNGMYLEKGRGLYVNIGLGYVLFPMRLGAWPEITIITLHKQLN